MARSHPNPCRLCPGSCCTELAVTVSVLDVARIHRHLQIPVHDFLARYVDDDPAEEPYAFVIRKQPIALALLPPHGTDRGCSFLMRIGDHLRCGIYEQRPGTCRVYPFTSDQRGVKHKDDTLCPRRFALADPSRRAIDQAIETYQREWNVHRRYARQWNEDPPRHASFEKLLDFVDEVVHSGEV